ncbi:MAG: CapA family protein, partial [Candidatus Atribacteria bacterium]|nr:CapA family protein [Candidatus Atribacteria bacterium]
MVRKILLVISILVLCGTLPILARDSVTFCAAGDVLLDRGIRMAIERQGIHYPFSGVSPVVSSYDLAFCNLESPISDRGDPLGKQFVFRGDPRSVESLLGSGFTIFSLANNHTLDYGRKALTDTISLLKKKGLFPLGAGKTQSDARQSLIIEKNGLRFAFIATVPM